MLQKSSVRQTTTPNPRYIYWIPRSRLKEDFAQFCLSGSLTVPLATLSAGRQASHFFLYCTYFYFNRIFWLVSNSLARTSLSLWALRLCIYVRLQSARLRRQQCESSEQSRRSLFSQSGALGLLVY